ncbi:hypothetical protein QMK38_18680 [Lysinibacillus fusiformis]|nr:hypothetical protein [Lysinibacillus fusiformis]
MYNTKQFKDDLYEICTTHYIKFKLLQDFSLKRIAHNDFLEELENEYAKSQTEIAEILSKLEKINFKIQQNGGQLSKDPIAQVNQLRKEKKLQEAFNLILPILQANRNNKEAVITFGWVMYDYLKLSENNIETYINNITILNDNVSLNYANINNLGNDALNKLKNSILWSFRKVIQKHESYANRILPQILRFCGHDSKFIERRIYTRDESSASRSLIKEIRNQLNDSNYLLFMDTIEFGWFDWIDYEASSFINEKNETIHVRPFAEKVLNFHAKKLISIPSTNLIEQKIHDFILILNSEIPKNPTFEWLSYYKAKLLMKVKRKEEALEELIHFAKTKSKEFWVWDLISELVDDDEKFNCLCAGLLCKTKPEMIVGIQEKIIRLLVKRELFSNAKFELDQLISTRMQKWGKISQPIADLINESWYSNTKSANTRENLKEYAVKAEAILYETLPYSDVFVTYVNHEKGVINFAYVVNNHIKRGYFYMDSINQEQDWKADQTLKVKMLEDKKRTELYKIYAIIPGDEKYIHHFIQTASGYVEKEYSNPFAFVDDVYIPPKLVKEYKIKNLDKIEYTKKRIFNKKRNTWGWTVDKINSNVKDTLLNVENDEY